MKNKIIWVDLDEILAELADYILEYNNYTIWDNKITKEEILDYYLYRIPHLNITKEFAISWFMKPMLEDIKTYKVLPTIGSLERLKLLKDNGNRLIIITARREDIFWEYTKNWLEMHFTNIFDDIVFTDHFSEKHRHKGEVCRELWVECMIEDNYDYALDLAESGIKTYVLEKPWNKNREEKHENIIKINNWDEFI